MPETSVDISILLALLSRSKSYVLWCCIVPKLGFQKNIDGRSITVPKDIKHLRQNICGF